ncbi:UNVERIFIED_CONTAM: site-specific recombinase XerD [Acetivibrio alkalicellulosi]
MTNNKAFEKMKQGMELRGFAISTQKKYLMNLRHFTNHFNLPFSEMNYDHVRDFLHHAIKIKKLSSESINGCYSAIRFLYETVFERDWNMKHIPRIKNKKKFPEVLSKDEVNKIFKNASYLKHKAMIVTAYSAGLRVSEVSRLKISDIDSKNMQIFIRQGKGNKDRFALLSKNNLEILRTYFKKFRPTDWLFPGQNPSNPISTRTIQSTFKEAVKKAGITKNVSPHTLRHSFATHLVEQGTNLIIVKDLLGHEKLETTMIYIHLARKDILGTSSPFDGGDFDV